MVTKTEMEKYLDAVKIAFRYSKVDTKEAVKYLSAEIDSYIAEFPNASFEDLVRVFGNPDDIAKQLITEMKPDEISSRIKFASFVKKAVLLVGTTILIIALFLAIGIFNTNKASSSQQSVDQVFEGTSVVLGE